MAVFVSFFQSVVSPQHMESPLTYEISTGHFLCFQQSTASHRSCEMCPLLHSPLVSASLWSLFALISVSLCSLHLSPQSLLVSICLFCACLLSLQFPAVSASLWVLPCLKSPVVSVRFSRLYRCPSVSVCLYASRSLCKSLKGPESSD